VRLAERVDSPRARAFTAPSARDGSRTSAARPLLGTPAAALHDRALTRRRCGRERLVRELELGAAARADRVVDLRHATAARAALPQLFAVIAVRARGEQPEHRSD